VLGDEAFFVSGKIGTARPDQLRPLLVEAVAGNGLSVKFDGAAGRVDEKLNVEGDLDVKAPAVHDLAIPFAALTGTSVKSWSGDVEVSLPATLKGAISLSGSRIRARDLAIKLGTQEGSADIDLSVAKAVTGNIQIDTKVLDLDTIAAAYKRKSKSAGGYGPKVDVVIKVDAATSTVRKTPLDNLKFAVHLTSSGPVVGSFATILPGQTSAVYDLVDAPTNRGHLKLETGNARTFLEWLGVDLGASSTSAFRALKAEGDILVAENDIKMTGLEATLDGVKMQGAFVRTRTERPSYGANLEVKGLDLAKFGTGNNVESWLDYLSALDVNLILKLRRFSGFDLESKSVDLKTQVVRGIATIEDLKLYGEPDLRLRGKLFKGDDGKLTGSMRLDGKKLKLCEAIGSRSQVAVPGCSSNPDFTSKARFDITAGRISGKVEGAASGVSFGGSLSGVETLFKESLNLSFRGTGEVGDVDYGVKGTAKGSPERTAVTANLEAEARDFPALLGFFGGMDNWSTPLLSLIQNEGGATIGADFALNTTERTFENLTLLVGSARLTGKGALPVNGKGLVLDVEGAEFDFLKPQTPGRWSNKKLELNLPTDVEGKLVFKLRNATLAGVPIERISFGGRVKAGGIDLSVSEATAFRGTWSGDLSLHPGKGGLYLLAEGKAADIDLTEFLSTYLATSNLSGSGNAKFSISADGLSVATMVSNSAGLIELEATKGQIKGFDIATFSSGLNDAAGELGARLVAEGTLSNGVTKYSLLRTELTLADGRLRTASLGADLESATLNVDGELNLPDLSIEGRATFDLVDHETLPTFKSQFSGQLKAPRARWDAEELILKFAEEWLLANQEQEVPDLPGAEGSSVVSEELDALLPAAQPASEPVPGPVSGP
jgi:AsmA-like protein